MALTFRGDRFSVFTRRSTGAVGLAIAPLHTPNTISSSMLPGQHALVRAAVATRSIVMIAISSRSRLDFQGRFRLFRRHAVLPIW